MSRPPRASTWRSAFHALQRRYRVSPRPPVDCALRPGSRTSEPVRAPRPVTATYPVTRRTARPRSMLRPVSSLATVHSRRDRTSRGSQIRINGPERPAPRSPAPAEAVAGSEETFGAQRPKPSANRWPATGPRTSHTADSPLEFDGPSTEVDRPRRTRNPVSGRNRRRNHVTPAPAVTPPAKRATHRSRADSAHRIPKDPTCVRAAVELSDTSHGVRCLSTKSARGSLCRITTPTPSARRVSHPLSGFIPSKPRGFVSRHIRPQASGLQSFFRAISRDTSRRPLLPCRFERSRHPAETERRSRASTSKPCSNRAADTRCSAVKRFIEPLLSWPFSPSRPSDPGDWAEALPSRAFICHRTRKHASNR
jgi:hypothetical protein